MNRSTLASTAAILVLTLGAVLPAGAQELQMGPYLAYHDDADLGVGGMVAVPLPSMAEHLSFMGDVGVFFPDHWGGRSVDVNYWEANANALFQFPLEDYSFTPWALAGLNIARWSVGRGDFEERSRSDTEIGINLGGGMTFGSGPIRPFVGVKVELDGGRGGVVFGGLAFSIDRSAG